MVFRCSVEGCNNEGKKGSGISLFRIPFEDDKRNEAKERRQRCIDFVATSKKWSVLLPTKSARVCSDHFLEADFERRYDLLPTAIKKLKTDDKDIGSCT